MKLISIVLIVSFFLEGFTSNMVSINTTLFVPLFSIVSLLIVYPYFIHDKNTFLKSCFALGLFYDLVYTDTLIINACVFVIVGLFIRMLNSWFSNHAISLLLMISLTIIFYRIIMYVVLVIVGFIPFEWYMLILSISSSFVLNVIYGEILYLITDFISKKYHIKKID